MADEFTELHEYEPTTAELKLLEVLCNPESATKSVVDICEEAGVSTRTYYTAFSKDGFKDLIKKTSIDLVKGKLAQIINATIKYAVTDSKCSADRKTLLQMADMLVEKTENKNSNTDTVTIKLAGELEKWAK